MKSSVTLSACCLLALSHLVVTKDQADTLLLGRQDGHEPGSQSSEVPLLGRPDGHEPGSHSDESSLPGKPDGHEPGSHSDESSLPGKPDGHEPGSHSDESSLPGKPDGHEPDFSEEDDYQVDPDSEDTYLDSAADAEEYDQETLVRCKRPLCLMYCENGFQTDSTGCQICQCKDTGSGLIGQPDGHEREVDCSKRGKCEMYCENGFKTGDDGCSLCECKENDETLLGRPDGHELTYYCDEQPLCRMYCDLGFQKDEHGCPLCTCLENPCAAVMCESGSECQPQPCENNTSCTKLSAKCIPASKPLPCPEPMCANACPSGYKNNEEGCMTCQCASISPERVCGAVMCDEYQICRNSSDNSPPKCSIKTLCETQREQPVGLGLTALQCEPDGSFKPLQCNSKHADCWCVDGLGREINGSRTTVYIDEHKPRCLRNNTVSMHIHMTLVVEHDIDVEQIDSLNSTIVDHVSSWLLIEPHYVKVAKAESVKSDDDDSEDTDVEPADNYEDNDYQDSPRLLIIELVILHDGQSDLPSALGYMQRRMHKGLCDIPFGNGKLQPQPDTLTTEHQFAQESVSEVIGEPDMCEVIPDAWECNGRIRAIRVGLCILGSVLFMLTVLSVIMSLHRRRRMLRSPFKHQILSSQVSIEKDYLNEKSQPVDCDSCVMKDEKMPIA